MRCCRRLEDDKKKEKVTHQTVLDLCRDPQIAITDTESKWCHGSADSESML